ncbi:MAG: iron-molybdenum cofactor biosynthesis protein [Candidatus Marinimicrobia bacterium]|nr:iron-molybdenum cofactor biosynthesis protein [Candidatus Neomarinimicrobiota bacterium]
MKIGIASNDQSSIAEHFGRTKGFVIVELENGQELSRTYRENKFSAHSQADSHEHGEHGHSHTAILDALADCELVVARGMGRRIYDDLRAAKIESYITTQSQVDGAIKAYLSGILDDNPDKGCVH